MRNLDVGCVCTGPRVLLNMPRRTISRDLKDRIPILRQQGYSIKDICDVLGICKSAAYQVLQNVQNFGVSTNPHVRQPGRPRSLDSTDVKYIKAILNHKHCLYLDEIQDMLASQRGLHLSLSTLCRTLRRLLFTSKRISARALERNDIGRLSCFKSLTTSRMRTCLCSLTKLPKMNGPLVE